MADSYDLTLLLDTAAEDDQRGRILEDVEAAISASGELVNRQDWGARPMAYEIRHRPDAEYHLFQFTGSPELLTQLQRSLSITDGVVRFRIVKFRQESAVAQRPSAGAEA